MRFKLLIAFLALAVAVSGSVMAQSVNHVSITNVTNTLPAGDYTTDNQLQAGSTHQIEITFDAYAGYQWLGSNAWEIYSPDGADWGYLSAERGDYIWNLPLKYSQETKCLALESFLKHGNKTGGSGTFVTTATAGTITQCFCFIEPCAIDDPYTTLPAGGNTGGTDTAAFFHAAVGSGVGIPGGTSGVAIIAEFTSNAEDHGKTICFDTNGVYQAWEWAAPGYPDNNGSDFPSWDNGQGVSGPICWEVLDPSGVEVNGQGNLPTEFKLNQNYPNPFNPSTTILFDVPKNTHVELSVFNVLGQKVATLINEELAPDSYEVIWDGHSDAGNEVASGIYFYRLKAESTVMTKKMMMLK